MKPHLIKLVYLFILLSVSFYGLSQNPEGFDKMATSMADKTVPIITSNQVIKLQQKYKKIIFLDARETDEYSLSHIKESIHIGYDNFEKENIANVDKNAIIIVYCSVGYRSGKIGKKLREIGYTTVFNLYGGVFDWVNNGNVVYNNSGKVKTVHPYNKKWRQWLKPELRGETK